MTLILGTVILALCVLGGVYCSTMAFVRGDVPAGCWWFAFSVVALIGGMVPWLR